MNKREILPLFCPSCQTVEMRQSGSLDSNLILDRCPECQGFWFDGGEMRQFLNSDSFKERFLGRSDDDDTLAEENGQRGCPRCEHDLQKLELNGITVDVCLECIGVWLDAGELESLIRAGREHSLDGDDSLWAHEIREGLDGRDIPPDLLGHLATAVKGLFSGSHSRE